MNSAETLEKVHHGESSRLWYKILRQDKKSLDTYILLLRLFFEEFCKRVQQNLVGFRAVQATTQTKTQSTVRTYGRHVLAPDFDLYITFYVGHKDISSSKEAFELAPKASAIFFLLVFVLS
jgi:hypothetical protein